LFWVFSPQGIDQNFKESIRRITFLTLNRFCLNFGKKNSGVECALPRIGSELIRATFELFQILLGGFRFGRCLWGVKHHCRQLDFHKAAGGSYSERAALYFYEFKPVVINIKRA
jgi:hypothetical protein